MLQIISYTVSWRWSIVMSWEQRLIVSLLYSQQVFTSFFLCCLCFHQIGGVINICSPTIDFPLCISVQFYCVRHWQLRNVAYSSNGNKSILQRHWFDLFHYLWVMVIHFCFHHTIGVEMIINEFCNCVLVTLITSITSYVHTRCDTYSMIDIRAQDIIMLVRIYA